MERKENEVNGELDSKKGGHSMNFRRRQFLRWGAGTAGVLAATAGSASSLRINIRLASADSTMRSNIRTGKDCLKNDMESTS